MSSLLATREVDYIGVAVAPAGERHMANPLRIFISSPGDVVPERRRAALVIENLAKDYARFFEIEPYLWETEPMLASGHFQDAIVPPGETDIVILILWARLGTPLPKEKYRGIDGRVPVTGTEWEFEAALAAHKQRGVPDLLAYKKKAPPKAEYASEADLEELGRQLQKFGAFWSRHFVDHGEFRAAFGEFENLDGFEAKLEGDLRRLIERRIAALQAQPDKAVSPTWLKGSPFRGLEIYRFEHAPIFFGRSEATKTAVEQLVENAEAGRPSLLVLGASGSGKSSLVQAGIVPVLGVRGVVAGVGERRRAVIRPGGHPGGPFMALAAAFADDDALPEVLKGQDIAALARHLEKAAADPSFPIVSALAAREQAARQKGDLLSFEEVRLILMVDQLEELFTLGEMTPDQRLKLHQTESAPLMDEMKRWLNRQLDEKLCEPNSDLGTAIGYMLNHWQPLTVFLRFPGAPLDSSIVERALKKAILHRRNSLFYKTQRGARVGDVFMSIIYTCQLSHVNPFDYLTALLRNADRLAREPAQWMPWNYAETFTGTTPSSAAT